MEKAAQSRRPLANPKGEDWGKEWLVQGPLQRESGPSSGPGESVVESGCEKAEGGVGRQRGHGGFSSLKGFSGGIFSWRFFDAEEAGGPPVPSHHSPFFKIAPRESVTLGTEAMTVAALDYLAPGPE